MKKLAIIIAIIAVVGISVFIGYAIYNKTDIKYEQKEMEITQISQVITDDCTEEYRYEKNMELIETNSEEEKTSPNAIVTFKKHYKTCGHTIIEEKSISSSLVNKTQLEFQEKYENWNIEKFSASEIIIYKELEGKCNEEFILKDVDGKIVIYKLDENNNEIEYEKTQISTDYLTDTDKININKGLNVIGVEELNKVIEDFE